MIDPSDKKPLIVREWLLGWRPLKERVAGPEAGKGG